MLKMVSTEMCWYTLQKKEKYCFFFCQYSCCIFPQKNSGYKCKCMLVVKENDYHLCAFLVHEGYQRCCKLVASLSRCSSEKGKYVDPQLVGIAKCTGVKDIIIIHVRLYSCPSRILTTSFFYY